MNHQRSGWSRVADSTPARIVGESASREPLGRIMSKYMRNMRNCEAIFADRAIYRGSLGLPLMIFETAVGPGSSHGIPARRVRFGPVARSLLQRSPTVFRLPQGPSHYVPSEKCDTFDSRAYLDR